MFRLDARSGAAALALAATLALTASLGASCAGAPPAQRGDGLPAALPGSRRPRRAQRQRGPSSRARRARRRRSTPSSLTLRAGRPAARAGAEARRAGGVRRRGRGDGPGALGAPGARGRGGVSLPARAAARPRGRSRGRLAKEHDAAAAAGGPLADHARFAAADLLARAGQPDAALERAAPSRRTSRSPTSSIALVAGALRRQGRHRGPRPRAGARTSPAAGQRRRGCPRRSASRARCSADPSEDHAEEAIRARPARHRRGAGRRRRRRRRRSRTRPCRRLTRSRGRKPFFDPGRPPICSPRACACSPRARTRRRSPSPTR